MNKRESFDQMLPLLNETTITCIMRQKAPMIDMNSAQQKYLYGNKMWNKFNIVAGKVWIYSFFLMNSEKKENKKSS